MNHRHSNIVSTYAMFKLFIYLQSFVKYFYNKCTKATLFVCLKGSHIPLSSLSGSEKQAWSGILCLRQDQRQGESQDSSEIRVFGASPDQLSGERAVQHQDGGWGPGCVPGIRS